MLKIRKNTIIQIKLYRWIE